MASRPTARTLAPVAIFINTSEHRPDRLLLHAALFLAPA